MVLFVVAPEVQLVVTQAKKALQAPRPRAAGRLVAEPPGRGGCSVACCRGVPEATRWLWSCAAWTLVILLGGDGEEEYSQYKDNYVDYARISTLKKVAPPTLPKPCKPDILSNGNKYSAFPPGPPTTTRNITTV